MDKLSQDPTGRTDTIECSILTIDIETYSDRNLFPVRTKPRDVIAMICCYYVDRKTNREYRYCLAMCIDGPFFEFESPEYETYVYDDEVLMIKAYNELVHKLDPDIVMGYNSYSYDFHYMSIRQEIMERSTMEKPKNYGRLRSSLPRPIYKQHDSEVFGKTFYGIMALDGIIYFDVMQYVRYVLGTDDNKLNTAAAKFVGDVKHDMNFKEMFHIIRVRDASGYEKVARYCMQDTELCYKLFSNLGILDFLVMFGNITNTSIQNLYFMPVSHKLVNMIYTECRNNNTILDTTSGSKMPYDGALVIKCKAGIYRLVGTVDYVGLYPSIIVSHNICPSTYLRTDTMFNSKAPFKVSVITETESRINIRKAQVVNGVHQDVIITHVFTRKYKGIIPGVLSNLIAQRATIKREIAKHKNDPDIVKTLKGREKALKVAANSVYGVMGVSMASLMFVPGAESTTAVGRSYIEYARNAFETRFNCNVIYGDTDSCFLTLRDGSTTLRTSTEIAAHLKSCCDTISKELPEGVVLGFENVFEVILLLSPKRYVYRTDDGSLGSKGTADVKGIYCPFIQRVFKGVCNIFRMSSIEDDIEDIKRKAYDYLRDEVIRFMNLEFDIEDVTYRSSYNTPETGKRPTSIQVYVRHLQDQGYEVELGDKLEHVIARTGAKSVGERKRLPDSVTKDMIDLKYYTDSLFSVFNPKDKKSSRILELAEVSSKVKSDLLSCRVLTKS
ncbi:DNA-directed DNA polymerase delta [Geranomyces michiganensis]|nr:DNA-directed DNA polymerase delta [Geranomyces michiganensis]